MTSEVVGLLDPHQQAAVAHGDGPAIVLAGPGSGKTRVIVERAVRLIDDEHARPEQPPILARPAARRRAMQAALAAEGDLGLHRTNAVVEEALRFSELCDDYLELPNHPLARVRAGYLAELAGVDYGGLQRKAIALLEQRDDTRRA